MRARGEAWPCRRPGLVVLVSPRPVPEGLLRAVEEAAGARAEWSPRPRCEPGALSVLHPRMPAPARAGAPGCYWVRIPHAWLAPDALRLAGEHGWCPPWGGLEAAWRASLRRLQRLREGYRPAWEAGACRPPARPPPVLVVGEVYHRGDPGETLRGVERLLGEGADMVSIGLEDPREGEGYLEAVARASGRAPVLADPGDPGLMVEALEQGACIGMSLAPGTGWMEAVPRELRGERGFVLLPAPRGGLERALLEARRLGYEKLILDPVLRPLIGPGALPGLLAAARAGEWWRGPILLGVNNVYELLDADTTGSIAVLVALAAEAGASLVLATEESPKAWGAVLEARMAADLASLALHYRSPPKDYPIRLLHAKQKRWVE